MERRGQINYFMSIVIVIVGALILGFAVSKIIASVPSTLEKETCHASVLARDSWLKGTKLTPEITSLKCKTQSIIIRSSNDEAIKGDLANSLYDCWWMLGEGKVDFFTESDWFKGNDVEVSKCIICSKIKFEDNAKNKRIDLMNYINTIKIPDKNLTYLEYLSGEKTILPAKTNIPLIDTNKEYAVVFMGIRGNSMKEYFSNIGWTAAAGTAGGAIVGGTIGFFIGGPPGLIVGIVKGGAVGFTLAGSAKAVTGIYDIYQNSHLSSIQCNGETGGCYTLTLTEATPAGIGQYCQDIESYSGGSA